MNLHAVRFKMGNVAIWLQAWGGNGRGIGVHLWPVEEGEPDRTQSARAGWQGSYWTPTVFRFSAFEFSNIHRDGWVPPLCGQRSASRRARLNQVSYHGGCVGCVAEAARRGIVPLTYTEAQAQSPAEQAIREEQRAWQTAGRPSPWPPSPSDSDS